ncbi:MAG TPA: aspartate kinase [Acidobacteriota bacterium]|nr:aspartate kinase [Acidobacteriota bacterium]
MIIMKFGGSSQRDVAAYERVFQAVKARTGKRPLVVLSAVGKTTDGLLEAASMASRGRHKAAHEKGTRLEEEHLAIASGLMGGENLRRTRGGIEKFFEEVRRLLLHIEDDGFLRPQLQDEVLARGELLSTWIFHNLLLSRGVDSAYLDARRLVRSDDRYTRAHVDETATFQSLRGAWEAESGKVCVLQGFIASGPSGETTTIGRGGSDLTACLAGAALGADEIQVWTDVPGILTADPRLVAEALKIKSISFDEAAELAYFGAKVLHPAALIPAIARDIPVYVLDSAHIERPGTFISAREVPSRTPIKSIACKPGISILNINSPRMLLAYGFARRIFDVFDRRRIPVDVIATSEVNVSVTIDREDEIGQLVSDLGALGDVQVRGSMAIVSVVGHSLPRSIGLPARVFKAVEDIEVRLISQGASRTNLTFLVEEEHMRAAVRRIHQTFFDDPDPEVFERLSA